MQEPLPADSPLWAVQNLHLTPHNSGNPDGCRTPLPPPCVFPLLPWAGHCLRPVCPRCLRAQDSDSTLWTSRVPGAGPRYLAACNACFCAQVRGCHD